jgi:hypothetical protein
VSACVAVLVSLCAVKATLTFSTRLKMDGLLTTGKDCTVMGRDETGCNAFAHPQMSGTIFLRKKCL